MGKGDELTQDEKQVIMYKLCEGYKACKIAKLLNRDARTIKKAIENIDFVRKPRKDKGRCSVSKESIEQIREVAQKHPSMSSKEIFDIAGIAGISKSLRCRVLREVGYVKNTFKRPSMSVENISTESLESIKAIMQVNPHLSSKDIFELAGVPDVGKTLRDQILKELASTVTHAANIAGTVATITDDTDEVSYISNEDVTCEVLLSEDTSADVVVTDHRDSDVLIIKEELVPDINRKDMEPLFQ